MKGEILLFILVFVSVQSIDLKLQESYSKCDELKCICNIHEDPQKNVLFNVDCSNKKLKFLVQNDRLPKYTGSLDFSENMIGLLNNSLKPQNEYLESLNLRSNSIVFIPDGFFEYLFNLAFLNLERNKIEIVNYGMFKGLSKLETLKLGYNNIKIMEDNAFIFTPSLVQLSLEYNKELGCALANRKIKDFVPLNVTILRLDGINVDKLDLDSFDGLNLEFLSLPYNPIQEVPHIKQNTLKYLDISGTNITNFSRRKTKLFSLQNLKMSHMANLVEIQDFVFNDLISLDSLIIEDCPKLKIISPLIFGYLSYANNSHNFALEKISFARNGLNELSYGFKNIFGNLKEIDLSGNPWKCDCKLNWLQEFKHKIVSNETLRCDSPEEFKDRLVLEMELGELSCFLDKIEENAITVSAWLYPLLGILSIVVVILVVLLILLGPYGKPGQYWTRSIGPESPYMPISFTKNDYERAPIYNIDTLNE